MTNTTLHSMKGTILALALLIASTTTRHVVVADAPSTRVFQQQVCVRKHAKRRKAPISGSLIRFQRPTADRVAQWFHGKDASFNHDSVGMTNPCLHISLLEEEENVMHVSSSSSDDEDRQWWPACSPRQNEKGWKMVCYRRRVGRGTACYDAVRDAALEWEFNDNNIRGIVQVHRSETTVPAILQRRESYGTGYDVIHNASFGDGDLYGPTGENALKIWSGPGGRRLATYTQVGRWKWAPRLFVVNPVTVVYDLVDQRGPGTTYTSTAYATCKGHWLRGEERLTVAHRDRGAVDVELVSYSKPANTLWGRMIWPLVGPLQGQFFESQMKALEGVAGRASDTSEASSAVMGAAFFNNNQKGRRGGNLVTH